MILAASIALIMATAIRPQSEVEGWIRAGDATPTQWLLPHQAPLHSTFSASDTTALASYMPQGAMMLSRIDWLAEQLRAYKMLEPGWDGEGSKQPSADHVDAAVRLVRSIPSGFPLPKPMLSANGDVGLYWETEHWVADAEIENDNSFSFFVRKIDRSNERYFSDEVIASNTWIELKKAFSF
jgi:hypothetical protein